MGGGLRHHRQSIVQQEFSIRTKASPCGFKFDLVMPVVEKMPRDVSETERAFRVRVVNYGISNMDDNSTKLAKPKGKTAKQRNKVRNSQYFIEDAVITRYYRWRSGK